MQTFEQRRFGRTIAVGVVLTVLVCLIDRFLLSALDGWFYDTRALYAQSNKRPDQRIEHIDIDDASLDAGAVGRWPWPHRTMARIIEEIGRAHPVALGLDVYLSEPEPETPGADAELADVLSRQKNLVLMADLGFISEITKAPEEIAATKEMASNLEMGPTDLLQRLRLTGNGSDNNYDIQNLFVRARKAAMRIRVENELRNGPLDDDQLIKRLLPHTQPGGISSLVINVLQEQAEAYRTKQAVGRFGFAVPNMPIAATPTDFRTVNLEMFTRSAKYSGFVNYDMFKSSVVRSVPLYAEADHLLYPQFGLAFACAILGADPRNVSIEANRCVIPVPGGPPISIPTHPYHSATLNRDVSPIMDIPWFGTSDWLTMYDWPAHTHQTNHISVNVVWDICHAIDKIKNNNQLIFDVAFADLFSGELRIDPAFYAEYAKANLAPDDSTGREKLAEIGLGKLKESGLVEQLKSVPVEQRNAEENTLLAKILEDQEALNAVPKNNRALIDQVVNMRKGLSADIAGKGVLFGWTVEGLTDHVSTSLHLRCPGVVVHGVIAQAVLSNRWWPTAPPWVGLVIDVVVGLGVSFIVAKFQPMRAVAGTAALLVAYVLINCLIIFDGTSWTVPIAGPVVAIVVVWSGGTLQRVIYEGVERNRVATEVAIINREMDLARKVQAALIPTKSPVIPGLEADGWTMAASVAGGDCYDLWTLPDGRLGILLADASGHGLAPAMVVSQVRTLVRAMCDVEHHPHDLLKRINARIAEDLEPGRFVTAFLGFLSSDGQLEYASAGHGPQFWYGCDGDEMELLDSTGAPLGADTEWFCDDPLPPVQMGAGCSLVVFSDGIFEAMTPAGELFGIDRLKEILHENRGKSGKTILNLVTDAMQVWQHKRPPADDQTVVIARRIPVAEENQILVKRELETASPV